MFAPGQEVSDGNIYQANMRLSICAGLLLAQRLRRWPNLKTTQTQRLMSDVECS